MKRFYSYGIFMILVIVAVAVAAFSCLLRRLNKSHNYKSGMIEIMQHGDYDESKVIRVMQGKMKKVDIFEDHVIAYMSPDMVRKVLVLHDQCKAENLERLLNPILSHGTYYIKYPRCFHITRSNKRNIRNMRKDLEDMKKLMRFGLYDFNFDFDLKEKQNIMISKDNSLKVVDQDIHAVIGKLHPHILSNTYFKYILSYTYFKNLMLE